MFLYEGLAYDLLAAAVGALLGRRRGLRDGARDGGGVRSEVADVTIAFSVTPTSVVIAYAIGVLLTLAVVAFSAWRVSRMNIVSGDPQSARAAGRQARGARAGCSARIGRRRSGRCWSSRACRRRTAIMLGLGVLLRRPRPRAHRARCGRDRAGGLHRAGLALVAWFVLPMSRWLLGDLKMNFSIFILGGLAIVVGASWAIMYNADLLLAGA